MCQHHDVHRVLKVLSSSEKVLSRSQLLCDLSLFKMVLKCDFPATPSTKATGMNRPGPMKLSIQFAGAATRSDFVLDYSCCSASPRHRSASSRACLSSSS